MKFRGRMTDVLAIKKFYTLLGAMAKLSKVCVLRLTKGKMFLILTETKQGGSSSGGPSVWCELDVFHFFTEFNMEGVTKEEDEIYLELDPDKLVRTLNAIKSSMATRALKMKLTRKHDSPCLSFEMELASHLSSQSSITATTNATNANATSAAATSRVCTHDVPVSLIPRRLWGDFSEPRMEAFDVSLYLPDMKQLKHLTERYKTLGSHVSLEANKEGRLKLVMETDDVNVVTHFKGLEVPRFDDTGLNRGDVRRRINESARAATLDDSSYVSVRVELKRLSLFLGAEAVVPRKVVANLVQGRMVHIFLVHDDVTIQYFIPAMNSPLASSPRTPLARTPGSRTPGTPMRPAQDLGPIGKLVLSAKTSLEKWNEDVKKGKAIIADISNLVKESIEKGDKREYDPVLDQHCQDLSDIAESLEDRVANLKRVHGLVKGFLEVESPSKEYCMIPTDTISKALETVCASYGQQCQVCQAVVEKIGHSETEDEVVVHSAVWVHQPFVDQECMIAERTIEAYLERQ